MKESPEISVEPHAIEVRARPFFMPERSDPGAGRFVFGYSISIRNRGLRAARLLERHWIIVDADGARHVVRGEGVVGRQPDLGPGAEFTYSSFCPLGTPWGTMEGTYLMEREDGELFEVDIPRFYLTSVPGKTGPPAPPPKNKNPGPSPGE